MSLTAFALAGVLASAAIEDSVQAPRASALEAPMLFEQPRAVTSIDIDAAGRRLVSASLDGTVRVWDLRTGKAGGSFSNHTDDVYAARFSRDGRTIVSTGGDGRVVVADAKSGRVRRSWRFNTWCAGLGLLPATRVAVGCADLRIRVLDPSSGKVESDLQAPGNLQYGYITSLSVSPDGRRLASSNPVTIFDLSTGRQIATKNSFLDEISYSPNGQRLAGGNMKAGAEIWSVEPLDIQGRLATTVPVGASAGGAGRTFTMPVSAVAWSPDGRLVATAGLDKLVRIWRVEGTVPPVEVARLTGHLSAVTSLSWKANLLASGALNGQVRVWSLDGVSW